LDQVSNKTLNKGIFWVITENEKLNDYKLLIYSIPCDIFGNNQENNITFTSKSGKSFNHEETWKNLLISNKDLGKHSYNYYPRGRVEIKNSKADIYINPNIQKNNKIIDEIKINFGLDNNESLEINIKIDGSNHYQCHLDNPNIK
jgi:hypothetical protein